MQIDHVKNVKKDPLTVSGCRGAGIRWLLSEKDAIPHFYMRLVSIEPGGMIPLHSHDVIHEMYIVRGRGAALSPQGETPLEPGNFVYTESNEIHGLKNTGSEDFELVCCINKPR